MLINELSKRTGVSPHTLRFYEKSGLIKGSRDENVTSNNYYHYDEETVERLELISYAKEVGFTINEIAEIIDAWFNNIYSKEEKLAILDRKLASIERKISDLKEMSNRVLLYKEHIKFDLEY
jgi:MerR family Zn(II)-responsive transcriptional regulator of zntA